MPAGEIIRIIWCLSVLKSQRHQNLVVRVRNGPTFPIIWNFSASLTFGLDYGGEPQTGCRSTGRTLRVTIGYEW
jgi:hypothetical protein